MVYLSNKFIRIMMISIVMIMLNSNCKSNGSEPIDDGPGGNDTIPEVPGWTLVWNDEFSGTEIDMNKWEHEVNATGGGNNELQYYTDRDINSYIEDGKLVIQGLEEPYTGPEGTREYTSARLRTLNKGDWKYGRFEIKALLPYGQGIWPAIWMLPTDWVYGGWAASGEIDIMEMVGHDTKTIHGTLHYGGEWPENVQSGDKFVLQEGTFNSDFHIFTLEWKEGEMKWFVDGIHYLTQNQWHSSEHGFPAPFDQRFHLLLNLAIGGNWPGNPNETTVFPQKMIVDFVRVYEKNEESNKELTITIWKEIARRYSEEEVIIGYDLLNSMFHYGWENPVKTLIPGSMKQFICLKRTILDGTGGPRDIHPIKKYHYDYWT